MEPEGRKGADGKLLGQLMALFRGAFPCPLPLPQFGYVIQCLMAKPLGFWFTSWNETQVQDAGTCGMCCGLGSEAGEKAAGGSATAGFGAGSIWESGLSLEAMHMLHNDKPYI